MQPSEEVYDHLADVHYWAREVSNIFKVTQLGSGKFIIHFSSIDSGGGEGEKR